MVRSLFAKTALILSCTVLALLVFTVAISSYYVTDVNNKERAAELASVIALTAKTYVGLPKGSKREFLYELKQDNLILGRGNERLIRGPVPDFYRSVARMVSTKLAIPVSVSQMQGKTNHYWIDIIFEGQLVRLGVSKSKPSLPLPILAIAIMTVIAVMAVTASLFLIRRATKPLERLADAAKTVGRGGRPEPLPESGPHEFSEATKAFNQMSADVHNLLENRTILLSGISHDIRTPLTRLALATEMLPKETDDELQDELRSVHRDIERIVEQYLSLTRSLESAEYEIIVVADILNDVIAELTFESNQEVVTKGDENCTISSSSYALRAVVVNILGNAIRYGLGSEVLVRWHKQDGSVHVSILDNGPGIPDIQKKEIFRPFYRLEGSRNSSSGGSGLGLAIVDNIVRRHKWSIKVCDRVGGGTEVVISIPNA